MTMTVAERAALLSRVTLFAGLPEASLQALAELAVIDRMPRMASVFAVGPTTCLALASWDLFRRVDGDPELVHSLLRGLALRVRHLSEHHSH